LITRRALAFASIALLMGPQGAFAAKKPKRTKTRRPRIIRESTDQGPETIVAGIYKRATKDIDGRVVTLSFAKEDRGRIFSAALASALTKADAKPKANQEDAGPIDFDPVTNSQGLTVKSFSIATEKREANNATLAVTIVADQVRDSPDENVIRYDFIREDGQWKIDDIQSKMNGKQWSVMQLLKRWLES
jgi:hypothetical protein